jgi:hypothetical protein
MRLLFAVTFTLSTALHHLNHLIRATNHFATPHRQR